MSDLSLLAWILLLAGGVAGGALGAAENEATPLDADQRMELQRIVAQAIALGFPDLKGARLYQGDLAVHWRAGSGNLDKICDGYHAKLADGSWMAEGLLPLSAHGGVTIDAQALKPVDWHRLEHDDSGWYETGDLLEVEVQGDCREDLPRAGALLATALCCGVARLDDVADEVVRTHALAELPWEAQPLGIFQQRYDVDFWLDPEHLSHASGYRRVRQDPVRALRIALAMWFRRQLLPLPEPFMPLPPMQAERAALAILAAPDPLMAVHLRLMSERAVLAALPVKPSPAAADLPARLSGWRIGTALQEDEGRLITEQLIARYEHNDDARMRAWLPTAKARIAEWQASRVTLAEAAALVALCHRDDGSLWLDQGQPRALGDQALRAITSLVEIDARLLAGREVATPWTPAERQAVAHGLDAWWAANAGRPLAQLQAAMLPTLPLGAIGHLLVMTDREQRRPLFDRLMSLWAAGPPAGAIAGVLGVAIADPAFAALVDSWPVAGAQRTMLAAWHAYRGDRAPGLALLDEALAMPANGPASLTAMRDALDVAGIAADAATLLRFQRLLAADPLPQASERLIIACPPLGFGAVGVLWDRMNGGYGDSMSFSPRLLIVRCALLAQCLVDRRAASPQLRAMAGILYHEWSQGRDAELAPDLRVCDVAALFARAAAEWLVTAADNERNSNALYFDPAAARAERDASIHRIIALLRPALMQRLGEATLPLAIPGLELTAPKGGLGDF